MPRITEGLHGNAKKSWLTQVSQSADWISCINRHVGGWGRSGQCGGGLFRAPPNVQKTHAVGREYALSGLIASDSDTFMTPILMVSSNDRFLRPHFGASFLHSFRCDFGLILTSYNQTLVNLTADLIFETKAGRNTSGVAI